MAVVLAEQLQREADALHEQLPQVLEVLPETGEEQRKVAEVPPLRLLARQQRQLQDARLVECLEVELLELLEE